MEHDGFKINVSSEIGTLRCLLIHSPDRGLGEVVPSKAQDWLFEDIVHLETTRKKEYDYYVKILMYFLDPEKIKGKLEQLDSEKSNRSFFKPDHPEFHHSNKVIELETLLTQILKDETIRKTLVAAVCAIEGCTYQLQQELVNTSPVNLTKIFISGSAQGDKMIFAPIPNFIFTRDIGKARARETLLARYIFFNHPLFKNYHKNILEIPNTVQYFLRPGEDAGEKTTLEGGDFMIVSKDHLLIGNSERTSVTGASEAIKILFKNNVVKKITVIKIPHKRDFMHIDTLFTQVKRNIWIILASIGKQEKYKGNEPVDFLSEKRNQDKPEIIQFFKDDINHPKKFNSIEDLLNDISKNDLKSTKKTEFIYSGNNVFPFDAREQWTDSCNVVALKEGVVLGYDRNDKTVEAFKEKGFNVIHVTDLINQFEQGLQTPETITDTLILIPSAELSRARGGFHCMSMPLLKEKNSAKPIICFNMQTTSNILMIRAVNFGFNDQTTESNVFQVRSEEPNIQQQALKEFNDFVAILRSHEVNVIVTDDPVLPHTPDSIFPNSWISFHDDGEIFLYPMYAENRRLERRPDIIELLRNQFLITKITDLSYLEQESKFLEGTGSMVLDRDNKISYACLSPRTDAYALKQFALLSGYKTVSFKASNNSRAIYHTNVMMCIGTNFAVVCLDSIYKEMDKQNLILALKSSHKEIVAISIAQMNHFAGNMLQVRNKKDEDLLVMSSNAFKSLTDLQTSILEKYCRIVHASLTTIERIGGGSARCMMAEIHLPHLK